MDSDILLSLERDQTKMAPAAFSLRFSAESVWMSVGNAEPTITSEAQATPPLVLAEMKTPLRRTLKPGLKQLNQE